jgi:hypothetical protein
MPKALFQKDPPCTLKRTTSLSARISLWLSVLMREDYITMYHHAGSMCNVLLRALFQIG